MKSTAPSTSGFGEFPNPWWQFLPPGASAGDAATVTEETGKQIRSLLEHDPMLASLDKLWNANPFRDIVPVDWGEIAHALRTVWLESAGSPAAAAATARLGAKMWRSGIDIWADAVRQWWGIEPVAVRGSADKRFAAAEWTSNAFYRSIKEAYLLASEWLLEYADAVVADSPERRRIAFHLQQFVDAMSPTLSLMTNPQALKRVVETGGTSLADGVRNLLSDLKEGRLSMVDTDAFAPGRNLALTPGKVVHRNRLIELIQYAPSTGTTHAIPLLILPPWINKYYILDMQPKNSLIRHLVSAGFTVFVVSWKNPEGSMNDVTFEDYMQLGPLAASDVVREITGSRTTNVLGYCIGGTLLAMTLAWLAAKDDERFNAATFMVSLQDFAKVGDTGVFLGDDNVDFIEQQMLERGYLDSREMSNMFNLLRSNDLIWSNVVNNYLLGQKPPAFDLLYWNSDGTRMAPLAHAWYLRNTYVENNLKVANAIVLAGEPLDLGRVSLDVYAVGAEKDHIVPWYSAWEITRLVSGPVRFVLASSGHIAGMINPPGGKGTYWVSPDDARAATAERWRDAAVAHEGSWWTDWTAWLAARSGEKGTPPSLGSALYPPLGDAPGTNVLER